MSDLINKLDGVGPVNNQPSINKLHHFVKKKMWHVTRDMYWGLNILSKF